LTVPSKNEGRRVLEVGPGTGAVTARIVRCLGANDTLELVELNESFVRRLEERFRTELAFQKVAPRARIHHCAVEEVQSDGGYDVIISGLPLNNFSPELVRKILTALTGMLAPGGTLSFFEYIAVRHAKSLLSGASERQRLRGVSAALNETLGRGEFRRDWVWPNVLPAWVHHVRAG
jgi:phosphatidylethanolamine/phosphatidyl-N-methylethanolamine N-methyltransferase